MDKKKTKKLRYKFYFINNRKENNSGITFWYRTEFYKYFKKNKDCIYSESKLDYSDRDIESKISNRLYIFNPSLLGNKHKLASLFSSNSINNNKSYFPLKYIINLNKISMPNFEKNITWFIKPSKGCGGASIVVSDKPEKIINEYKEKYNKFIKKKNLKYLVVEKEIKCNLIKKRKWDLRAYYLVVYNNNKLSFYLYNDGLIRIAQNEYNPNSFNVESNLTNTTQIKSIKELENIQMVFSDLDKYELYKSKLKYILKDLSKSVKYLIDKNYISKYKLEYHLFGADIMYDTNDNPIILEMNVQPAAITYKNTKKIKSLKKKMYKELFNLVINNKFLNSKENTINFELIHEINLK
jgi:hypothetical protein